MEELLHEIQELKKLVEQLLLQQQTTISEPWSKEKVDFIDIRYQQIKQLREDWVSENDIGKYIRSSWYRTGAFIREELGFINCIKDGHYYSLRISSLFKEVHTKIFSWNFWSA